MKLKAFAMISIVLIVLGAIYFNQRSVEHDGPPFYSHLKSLNGFDAKAIEGKPVLVHFWAKWCAPCAEEIPHLVDFAKKAGERIPELRILAVSLDANLEESKTILPNHGADLPANLKLYLDPEHQVAEAMGSYQYPETFFFNAKGEVVEKWVGPQKWGQSEVMEYFVRKLAAAAR